MPLKKSHFLKLTLHINSVKEKNHNCVIIAYFSTYLNFRAKNGKNTHVYSDVDFWQEKFKMVEVYGTCFARSITLLKVSLKRYHFHAVSNH